MMTYFQLYKVCMDKAHGWDQLSISMIKTCGNSITFPMKLILKSMINKGIFLKGWKKSNAVPVHEKESKNLCCLKVFSQ